MLSDWILKRGEGIPFGWYGYTQERIPSEVQNGRAEIRERKRGSKLLMWLFALAANTIATWQVYHFQFSSGFDLFPGPRGDTRLTVYLVEHWYQALSGHATLLSPAMFYPVKGTLGYTDALIAYVLPYSLLRLSGLDIFHALGLAVIFLNYLNFIVCFVLLNNAFKFRPMAACAGAMFFAFNNPKLAQADHLQLQPLIFLVLVVLLVMMFAKNSATLTQRGAFGLLSLAGIFLTLQLLTSSYIGWFLVFWFFLFLVMSLSLQRSRRFILALANKYWPALSGALCVFLLGFAFFLRIYLPTVWSTGWFGFYTDYIPEFKSYLLMADGNYVWGGLTALILQQGPGGPDWGRRIGIGLIPSVAWIGISVFALGILRKYFATPATANGPEIDNCDWGHRGYLFFALMVLASNFLVILGLQYHGHSLWKFVYWIFPGARSVRAVARFVIVLALPMAIAFAFALHHAIEKIASQKTLLLRAVLGAVTVVLVVFGSIEQFNSEDGQYYSINTENARLEKLAAKLPVNCSSFYVAARFPADEEGFQNQNYMHDAMFVSILRGVPTLNGRSGKNPPGWSLRVVGAPEYEDHVRRWIKRHHLGGNICRLEIDD